LDVHFPESIASIQTLHLSVMQALHQVKSSGIRLCGLLEMACFFSDCWYCEQTTAFI